MSREFAIIRKIISNYPKDCFKAASDNDVTLWRG